MLTFAAETTTTDAAGAGIAIGLVILFAIIGILYLVWYIWLILDMNKYPDSAWVSSGQTKSLWQILWVIGLCIGGGLIIGLIYQFAIRPKVQQAAGVV